jgi:hypothetical protein
MEAGFNASLRKSPSFVSVLSQVNTVRAIHYYFITICLSSILT